jgi:hypothetical protein
MGKQKRKNENKATPKPRKANINSYSSMTVIESTGGTV